MRANPRMLVSLVFFLLACSLAVFSLPLNTEYLEPRSVNMCGNYSQNITIRAYNILNTGNETLANVSASLIMPDDVPIGFISGKKIYMGNIAPYNYSSSQVSWLIGCNGSKNQFFKVYILYEWSNQLVSSENESFVNITTFRYRPSTNLSIMGKSPENTIEDNVNINYVTDNKPTLNITTSYNSLCRGSLDELKQYEGMDIYFQGNQKMHGYTFANPLSEGNHIFYAACNDTDTREISEVSEIRFTIDTIKPTMAVNFPKGTIRDSYFTINISTSEKARCKFSPTESEYDSMAVFERTDSQIHEVMMSNYVDGVYQIYVACRDDALNINKLVLRVNVRVRPEVEIKLDKNSPIKDGLHEITVISSKNLKPTPVLRYYFSDDPSNKRSISLVGSNNLWTGYMLIDEKAGKKIGTFEFQGFDKDDTEGTGITSGELFLVDTIKPDAIDTVVGRSLENGYIKLQWHYPSDEKTSFNIYKSDTPGVGYINYYFTTNSTQYIDAGVFNGKIYYYKVAAVDEAENVGPLSSEIAVNSEKSIKNTESKKQTENPTIVLPQEETLKEFNSTIKNIETLLMDIDYSASNLANSENKNVISKFDLVNQTIRSKEESKKFKDQLLNVRAYEMSDSELRTLLSQINVQLNRIKLTTPADLKILEKYDSIQATTPEDILNAVEKTGRNTNLTKGEKEGLKNECTNINNNIKVKVSAYRVSIKTLSESSINKTLIIKKFYYESPEKLHDVSVVESVPKSMAGSANELELLNEGYSVLERDPIITWHFDELSYDEKEISYIISTYFDLQEVKSSKTVVVPSNSGFQKKENILTGLFLSINRSNFSTAEIVSVILGIIMVTGLLTYYIVFIRKSVVLEGYEDDASSTANIYLDPQSKSEINSEVSAQLSPTEGIKQPVVTTFDSTIHRELSSIREESFESGLSMANWAYKQGNLDKAEKLYKELLPRYPGNLKVLYGLADIYKVQEDYQNLFKIYKRILNSDVKLADVVDYATGDIELIRSNLPDITTQPGMTTTRADSKEFTNNDINVGVPTGFSPSTYTLSSMISSTTKKNAPSSQYFMLKNGQEIKSILELYHCLKNMDDEMFNFHANANKNDFANWLSDVFGEIDLANKIRQKPRQEILGLLQGRLE